MGIVRILFRGLVFLPNLLAIGLLLASAYSDRVSPETSLLFSYLGLAFPLLCLLVLCFAVYWFFLGTLRFVCMNALAFLLCWEPVSNYLPFHAVSEVTASDRADERVLKVLTYNVMSFDYSHHTGDNPNPILQYIAASEADIVCLQEYTVFDNSKKFITSAKVNKALSMYPYHAVVHNDRRKGQGSGVAVYSKYPIKKSGQINYDSDFNVSAIDEIDLNGQKLTLINNHLESFKLTEEDRKRYNALIQDPSSEGLSELRGAITQKLGPAYLIRAKQAEAVAKAIQEATGDYVLVCGDFNDTPVSYAHRTIQGDLLDAFEQSGRGLGVTYNRNSFWFRIDHILHSRNIRALNCKVDPVDYSDHYPVSAYLRLE